MTLKLDQSLFRKLPHRDSWVASEKTAGFEIIIPGNADQPNEADLVIGQSVVDHLEELKSKATSFFHGHLVFRGEYEFGGIELLASPDKHGVKIIMNFTNDQDGYLWIEAGFKPNSDVTKMRVHYALSMYY